MNFNSEFDIIIKDCKLNAIQLNSEYISSYHFLLSTLNSDNFPRRIFESRNISFRDLVEKLQKDNSIKLERYFLTQEFETTLNSSKYYAKIYYQKDINPEHIILAMLADKNSLAGKYLNSIELSYINFKNDLESIVEIRTNKILEFFGSSTFFVSLGVPRLIQKFI
ncbi:ClpA/ClpB-like protein [Tenacibaculum sp. 190524A05c]|uniref:Clp protease N-terminal domain-containing protein n=1 Tax=Tenacibaculum platacis TaxID=3137852 RepID=UPI0031FB2B49